MLDPKHDPFFAQPKADVQADADQADRSEIMPVERVLAELDDLIARKCREENGFA